MNVAARLLLAISAAACIAAPNGVFAPRLAAQMHRVEKPESVTRAVAVYEYTGDMRKPTAARLIPVSLYLGGHFEDAGTYLSRPIPLTLETGTAYELQHAGVRLGFLDLAYARNFRQNSAEAANGFDEGWFGYGRFREPRKDRGAVLAKNGKGSGHAYEVKDDGKPHFGSKPPGETSGSGRQRPPAPDPADTERTAKVSLPDDTGKSRRDPDEPDPERPTLKRSSNDTQGGPKQKKQKDTASVSQTPVDPASDPDRPALKRRGSGDSNAGDGIAPDPSMVASRSSERGEGGTVTGGPSLNDPNRPNLHRGKPTEAEVSPDLPKFQGRPADKDLKQTVAVSDAKDRPEHDFSHHFDSASERAEVMTGMETLARAVLANPALATDAPDSLKKAGPADQASTEGSRSGKEETKKSAQRPARGTATRSRGGRQKSASGRGSSGTKAPGADGEGLEDEQLSAFELSYGAPVTYVLTAHTAESSSPVRYVTVVAQPDPETKLQVVLRSTTDSAHLDRTPRYRLVDAVDADASNRASLLFEVRSMGSRQFALYRLLGSRTDQIFETGVTR